MAPRRFMTASFLMDWALIVRVFFPALSLSVPRERVRKSCHPHCGDKVIMTGMHVRNSITNTIPALAAESANKGMLSFRGIFSDIYEWIREGKSMDETAAGFPTFLTGHQELSIVDAVFKSHELGKWVDVAY